MAGPLDEAEVKQTAYSISTWCWSGGGARWHFDHSSAAQRRRGLKLGKLRRSGTPLERNREPWKAEGMSRRTWYRKQRFLDFPKRKFLDCPKNGTEPNQWGAWGGRG